MLACVIAQLLPASSARADHRVLLLQSYHHGLEWAEGIQGGVQSALNKHDTPLELHLEYLDAARLGALGKRPAIDPIFLAYLQAKFAQMPLDAVIVADNPALDLFLAHRASLAPGVPLIFCGVNGYRPQMLAGHPKVTGVAEAPSFRETLETAAKLFPGYGKLLVLGEDSVTFRSNLALLEQALAAMPSPPQIEVFVNADIAAIEARLSSLGPQWLVFPMVRPSDVQGLLPIPEAAARISSASPVPVLAGWDFWMGHGPLGGKVVSSVAQGHAAGVMTLSILAGADASAIPVMTESPNRFVFDHTALVRFGVHESRLRRAAVRSTIP